jgi:hypothetical protein
LIQLGRLTGRASWVERKAPAQFYSDLAVSLPTSGPLQRPTETKFNSFSGSTTVRF